MMFANYPVKKDKEYPPAICESRSCRHLARYFTADGHQFCEPCFHSDEERRLALQEATYSIFKDAI